MQKLLLLLGNNIMLKLSIIFLLFINISFANSYDKYLKSKTRATITLQKIVDNEGDYQKALEFSKLAFNKYPNNIMIQQYRAKALYLLNDLQNAKILFIKVLEKDPTNDIAADFIVKIEAQEKAQKNKDLESTLGYLSDKGLDFILIFLGFLGAEVLGRKYTTCNSNKYAFIINQYIYFYNVSNITYLSKLKFLLTEYFHYKNLFSLCNILSIIILLTISSAVTISFYWLELIGYINIFIDEETLKIITSNSLQIHYLIVLFFISLLIIFISSISHFIDDNNKYTVSDILEELLINNEFSLLRENMKILNDKLSKEDLDEIIEMSLIDEHKDILKNLKA
jgi:tetratricopeptide (TPR) repeat protein